MAATFLEKLMAGYYTPTKVERLDVGEAGGYPKYRENDELTAESFNTVTYKIDEIIDNTNDGFTKLLASIRELAQSGAGAQVDNKTLRINSETGKMEVIDIPQGTRSDRIIYIDPTTGEATIKINEKIHDIENRLTNVENSPGGTLDGDYVMFIVKGEDNAITLVN